MARLISWPIGLKRLSLEPLTGPRTVGAASNESMTGFVQTVASAFGAWRWTLSFPAMNKGLFRSYRGMVVGLNGGANAVRVPFDDPDVIGFADAGVTITAAQERNGLPFSNGESFSNGKNWQASRPPVVVSADAALGDTIISLADTYWGHGLMGGEWLGFFPFHFGLYVVTEVIDAGQYRVWPPLRKAIDTETYCTLRPVMAMRLEGEAAATSARGKVAAESTSMTLVEVQDADVRDYFAD